MSFKNMYLALHDGKVYKSTHLAPHVSWWGSSAKRRSKEILQYFASSKWSFTSDDLLLLNPSIVQRFSSWIWNAIMIAALSFLGDHFDLMRVPAEVLTNLKFEGRRCVECIAFMWATDDPASAQYHRLRYVLLLLFKNLLGASVNLGAPM